MYNGSVAPTGWALCDGVGGRPDLRNKFVIGAGSSYTLAAEGGDPDAVLIAHSHSVSGNTSNVGNHAHNHSRLNFNTGDTLGIPTGNSGSDQAAGESFSNNYTTGGGGAHSHSVSGNTSTMGNTENGAFSGTETGVNKNLPPYYALTYIIKT